MMRVNRPPNGRKLRVKGLRQEQQPAWLGALLLLPDDHRISVAMPKIWIADVNHSIRHSNCGCLRRGLIGECRFALHSGAYDTPSAVAL